MRVPQTCAGRGARKAQAADRRNRKEGLGSTRLSLQIGRCVGVGVYGGWSCVCCVTCMLYVCFKYNTERTQVVLKTISHERDDILF